MGFYLISDGTDKPFRCKIRTSSFTAMTIIPKVMSGYMVADMTAFFGSLDVVAPEVDR
jgi:NADH-quinone oxidoreductase subunit D